MKKVLLAVALATMLAAPSLFAQGAAPQDRHPDWSGVYRFARGADLAGFKLVAPDLDAEAKAHLRPWARLKMLATNGTAEDRGAICQPDGLVRQVAGPA